MKKLSLLFLLAAGLAFADTPPPGAVKLKNSGGTIIDPATETTLASIDAKTPASPAQEHVVAASPSSCRLSDGTAFYKGTTPADTQPVSVVSLPLPSGGATSANQATEIASLASIDSKLASPMPVSGPLTDAQLRASAVPVSASALPLPTGAATSANQSTELSTLASILSALGSPSQEHVTAGSPNSSRLSDGTSFYKATTPSDTQPVSAASLPLPSGASTAANQSTGNASLSSIDGKIPASPSQEHVTAGSPHAARLTDGTSFYKATTPSDTQPVSAAALPLPSGASTSANQTTANSSLSSIDGKLNSLGQKTSANSVPVVLPSDQTVSVKAPVNVTGSGSAAGATVSGVTTLTAPANAVGFVLMNLDVSTTNMRWAVGRTATTTLGQQLQPGRDTGFVPVGANISIIAESGTVTYDVQWVSQ